MSSRDQKGDSYDGLFGSTALFDVNQGRFLLLGGFLVVAATFFIQAQALDRPDSKAVPLIILYFFTVMIFFTGFMEMAGTQVKRLLGMRDTTSGFDFQDDDDDQDDDSANLFELNPFNVVKHFVWICGYLLFMTSVGFWTGNALFISSYILINERSPLSRRIPYAAGWTIFLLTVIYLLLVVFLNVVAIWRLGFLP